VCGLFRVSCAEDDEVTLIVVDDGVPSSVVVVAGGREVLLTFSDSRRVVMVSADDGRVGRLLSVDHVGRPLCAVPVNGQDNGFLVCTQADDRLSWFLCGHQLHDEAARSLEEPVRLRCLSDVSVIVADAFGSYVALHPGSVCLHDSTFLLQRQLLSSGDRVTSLALSARSGRLVIGQRDGVLRLYQLLRMRQTSDVTAAAAGPE